MEICAKGDSRTYRIVLGKMAEGSRYALHWAASEVSAARERLPVRRRVPPRPSGTPPQGGEWGTFGDEY